MAPHHGRFISYLRVSTDRQGRSGLGVEAQRKAVEDYLDGGKWTLLGEFVEVESGKRADRPKLAAALGMCRLHNATLVIAKLDRLSRNTQFLLNLVEGTGDAGVVFCDLPTIPTGPMGKFFITQMVAVAELEAGLISQRTKAALAAAKARGKKLGNPQNLKNGDAGRTRSAVVRRARSRQRAADLRPVIEELRASGATSLGKLAAGLNERRIPTPLERGPWTPIQVSRVLSQLEAGR